MPETYKNHDVNAIFMKKVVQRGAEAVLYLEDYQGKEALVKERIQKGYRIANLDKTIRSRRTRGEAKLLENAKGSGVKAPEILETSDFKIIMEYVRGSKLKDVLNNLPQAKRQEICRKIGEIAARLHSVNIIHGDLTTSNLILTESGDLYIIDFGLGKFSNKVEDQAVDLFLLYEALKSTHFKILEDSWAWVLEAYSKNYPRANEIFSRIEKIKKRRRYK